MGRNHHSPPNAACTAWSCLLCGSPRFSFTSQITCQLCFQTSVALLTAPGEFTRIAAYTPHRFLASAINRNGSGKTHTRDAFSRDVHLTACNVGRAMNDAHTPQVTTCIDHPALNSARLNKPLPCSRPSQRTTRASLQSPASC